MCFKSQSGEKRLPARGRVTELKSLNTFTRNRLLCRIIWMRAVNNSICAARRVIRARSSLKTLPNKRVITFVCSCVNACVILRRDNFDHPFVLCILPVTNLQSSLSRLFCHTTDRCGPPPCGRSSPPGHAVVDGWRRDERTRDIPQSLPRSLVSSAKPTTGVQVVRSAAPAASTRSLLMPTEQGLSTPGHDGSLRSQRSLARARVR